MYGLNIYSFHASYYTRRAAKFKSADCTRNSQQSHTFSSKCGSACRCSECGRHRCRIFMQNCAYFHFRIPLLCARQRKGPERKRPAYGARGACVEKADIPSPSAEIRRRGRDRGVRFRRVQRGFRRAVLPPEGCVQKNTANRAPDRRPCTRFAAKFPHNSPSAQGAPMGTEISSFQPPGNPGNVQAPQAALRIGKAACLLPRKQVRQISPCWHTRYRCRLRSGSGTPRGRPAPPG